MAARLGPQFGRASPSNHGGFLGNEYGKPGKPEEFAKKLREVLTAR